MKTLTLRNVALTINTMLVVDIFATIDQMQVPGFDTRFTNMTISGYGEGHELATQTLGNIQEVEQSYQAIVALAETLPGIGLYVADMNDQNGLEVELVAP